MNVPNEPTPNIANEYAQYLAERDEILRHKWLESEKAGYDVGFELALIDWIRHHRTAWREQARAQRSE